MTVINFRVHLVSRDDLADLKQFGLRNGPKSTTAVPCSTYRVRSSKKHKIKT